MNNQLLRSGILCFLGLFLWDGAAEGQLSTSSYRALGQPNLRQSGINIVGAAGMSGPGNIALDPGSSAIYVSDTNNNRILAWHDRTALQNGQAADLVLGQPNAVSTFALGIGPNGLSAPLGLAVEPGTGNLYVADFGNHRVLRFLAPFSNPTRVDPDAVFGQPNFATHTANSSGIGARSMRNPRGAAFDSKGNLWILDTGNNRVLRFPSGSLTTVNPAADLVIGQKDFTTASANLGTSVNASGLDTPAGLALDPADNLYVSDFNNARVLRFSAPVVQNAAANIVWGQTTFTTKTLPSTPSSSSLGGPQGLSATSDAIFVSIAADNRILAFPTAGGTAKLVLGQAGFTSTQANAAVAPHASAATLSAPADVKLDASGNVWVADTGNNRVLVYPPNTSVASRVLGQTDVISNETNQAKPNSINAVYKITIDYTRNPAPLYAADSGNHRVLIWRDSAGFVTGAAADLVIGQPDLNTALPNVDGANGNPTATSLSSPHGVAVDSTGTLYVSDSGNNRILRYPSPLSQVGRIMPDAVIGQPDFVSNSSASVSASRLKTPGGLAIDASGNLFVADSGNNRVLEFPSHPGNGSAASRVYGQGSFTSGGAPTSVSSQTLASPQGVAIDGASNLYVADLGENRVVIYTNAANASPTGAGAAVVIGQGAFNTSNASSGSAGLRAPIDVGLDASGTIYISDGSNNRVLGYASLLQISPTGAVATTVFGQANLTGSSINFNTTDGQPTAESLFSPAGIFFDRRNTLYISDSGNSRIIQVLRALVAFNAALNLPTAPVSRGAVVTAFGGGGLSDTSETFSSPLLPQSLASRQIVVDDTTLAPLFFVGQTGGFTQVNLFFPTSVPVGQHRIALRDSVTKELIAGTTVSVVDAQPGLSSFSGTGAGPAAALNQDGTLNSASNPAARGTVVILFGTGMGPLDQTIPDGTPAPASPLANTLAVPTSDGTVCLNSQQSVCVAIGSTFGSIQFSGLTPGFFGLWQLNVQIPPGALTGPAIPVRAVLDGTPSNLVTIAIK